MHVEQLCIALDTTDLDHEIKPQASIIYQWYCMVMSGNKYPRCRNAECRPRDLRSVLITSRQPPFDQKYNYELVHVCTLNSGQSSICAIICDVIIEVTYKKTCLATGSTINNQLQFDSHGISVIDTSVRLWSLAYHVFI
uniref:Uncharacterized protein n=1 Tax=Heterorhabditis bacteriophora TaxID=37862 RepID=A0A1I7XVN9_HETBA